MSEIDWFDGKCVTCGKHVYSMPYDFSMGHGHVYDVITELEFQLTGLCGWCFDSRLMGV